MVIAFNTNDLKVPVLALATPQHTHTAVAVAAPHLEIVAFLPQYHKCVAAHIALPKLE